MSETHGRIQTNFFTSQSLTLCLNKMHTQPEAFIVYVESLTHELYFMLFLNLFLLYLTMILALCWHITIIKASCNWEANYKTCMLCEILIRNYNHLPQLLLELQRLGLWRLRTTVSVRVKQLLHLSLNLLLLVHTAQTREETSSTPSTGFCSVARERVSRLYLSIWKRKQFRGIVHHPCRRFLSGSLQYYVSGSVNYCLRIA